MRILHAAIYSLLLPVAAAQLISFISNVTIAQASEPPSSQNVLLNRHATLSANIRFAAPPDRGAPQSGRARGGASRGDCPDTPLPLVTLVPSNPSVPNNTGSVGLTASAHPTFWFYLPFPLSLENTAEFLLLDEDGNYLYNTTISDSQGNAGVIKVAVPDTVPALAMNKTYTWMFQVNCGIGNPISTWGEIERVELDQLVVTQLNQASAREQAALYAANGIWYEALTTLAELRLANPTDPAITTDWTSLLESAGLADVAEQPLLPCCESN